MPRTNRRAPAGSTEADVAPRAALRSIRQGTGTAGRSTLSAAVKGRASKVSKEALVQVAAQLAPPRSARIVTRRRPV